MAIPLEAPGSRGSIALCALPCFSCAWLQGVLAFQAPFTSPSILGSSIHDLGVFRNVHFFHYEKSLTSDIPTRHVMIALLALLLAEKVEGACSHAA